MNDDYYQAEVILIDFGNICYQIFENDLIQIIEAIKLISR